MGGFSVKEQWLQGKGEKPWKCWKIGEGVRGERRLIMCVCVCVCV
jgi:hypothetical protein